MRFCQWTRIVPRERLRHAVVAIAVELVAGAQRHRHDTAKAARAEPLQERGDRARVVGAHDGEAGCCGKRRGCEAAGRGEQLLVRLDAQHVAAFGRPGDELGEAVAEAERRNEDEAAGRDRARGKGVDAPQRARPTGSTPE